MPSELSPQLENFIVTWSANLAIGGAACMVVGFVAGWIIWKNTRRLTEEIEAGNRDAFAEYEHTSDEVSKIRAELSDIND